MTRLVSLLLAAFGALLLLATPASADEGGTICSETANVGWEVDLEAITVTGVHVEVPGCDDGEFVGIELITDHGDVPSQGPLTGEVVDEVAMFDVSSFELSVEPITGIRVYLEVDEAPVPVVAITVEQRFFNPAGNEQVGLRVTMPLTVPFEQLYIVPSADSGYDDIDCADVNLFIDDADGPIVAWGAGDFVATASGRHIACYQQGPGTPGGPSPGPPGAEEPEVLGVVLEREASNGDDTVLGRTLARTGLETIHLVAIAGFALVAGAALLHGRRGHPTRRQSQ